MSNGKTKQLGKRMLIKRIDGEELYEWGPSKRRGLLHHITTNKVETINIKQNIKKEIYGKDTRLSNKRIFL